MKNIGYYVHHHGTGHLRRSINVVSKMKNHVYLFSSVPQPSDLPANVTYIHLPDDKVSDYIPNADNYLPYTPYSQTIFERNKIMVDAWQHYNIKHIHVDVSVEVGVLAKLHGLSVSYTIMHGDRRDKSHSLAYEISDLLVGFLSESFDNNMRNTETPVVYTGGISRYAKETSRPSQDVENVTIITSPLAERSWSDEIISLARHYSNIQWECVGFKIDSDLENITSHGKIAEPHEVIKRADVVIGSGGNNTIMEISSLAKPFICIPESRPYDEQTSAANSLKELHAAVVLDSFPTLGEWPSIVANLEKLDMQAFANLTNNDSRVQAAKILDNCAR